MSEEIKKKLSKIQNRIDDAQWELEMAEDELSEIYEAMNTENNNSIKDINNLKRELKRDGLYSDKIEEFLENYMKFYN